MTSETEGQRIVRECEHVDQFGDLPEVPGACAFCIDALVKRERAGALSEFADELAQVAYGVHWDIVKWLRARAAEEEDHA